MDLIPIAVDLDGTLLKTDSLYESVLALLRARPFVVFLLPFWLLAGRASLKARVADAADPAIELWPLRADLVAWLTERARNGHPIVLATAANEQVAKVVGRRLPFLAEVIASDGERNLKGEAKATALASRYPGGFIYVGNDRSDAAVWRLPGAIPALAGKVSKLARWCDGKAPVAVFADDARRPWSRALRPHQWSKNLLVIAPLLLSGNARSLQAWGSATLALVALCAIASGTYLLNDLSDLDSDRQHRTKHARPLASGDLAIVHGVLAMMILLALGAALAALLGSAGAALLAAYAALTISYSFGLKRKAIVDVTVIGLLFTLRLLLGAAAIGVPATRWLLLVSMFLFVSLALGKRCVEVRELGVAGRVIGRGYRSEDLPVLLALGVATATGAVLVFVMYLIEEAFPTGLYRWPGLLWMAPIILFIWLGRMWLLCGRGELHEDPVLFAMKDRASIMLGGAMLLIFAGSMKLPPI
ncbi:MAG: UbiA family prenyltransferase [Novosphingobium sp.]